MLFHNRYSPGKVYLSFIPFFFLIIILHLIKSKVLLFPICLPLNNLLFHSLTMDSPTLHYSSELCHPTSPSQQLDDLCTLISSSQKDSLYSSPPAEPSVIAISESSEIDSSSSKAARALLSREGKGPRGSSGVQSRRFKSKLNHCIHIVLLTFTRETFS